MSFILASPYSKTFDGGGRIRIHLIGELRWRLDKCFQKRRITFCSQKNKSASQFQSGIAPFIRNWLHEECGTLRRPRPLRSGSCPLRADLIAPAAGPEQGGAP